MKIPRRTREIVEFYAAESYPLEVMGFIVGDSLVPIAHTRYAERSRVACAIHEETDARAQDMFDDIHFTFHSHPFFRPDISPSIGPVDLDDMDEGDLEWIVFVAQGARKFRFRHKIYRLIKGRPRLVKPEWVVLP